MDRSEWNRERENHLYRCAAAAADGASDVMICGHVCVWAAVFEFLNRSNAKKKRTHEQTNILNAIPQRL